MEIMIVSQPITLSRLKEIVKEGFGTMVKAVVDTKRRVMAVSGELHADEEALLLDDGSCQIDLWGINLYPEIAGPDWLEFDSMINLRPSQKNMTRGVDDPEIRQQLISIVSELVK